jgi:hypothetical protein
MEEKVMPAGDWFRKLAERVGMTERDQSLPEWVLEELRPMAEVESADGERVFMADVPQDLKRRLQAEAVQKTFHRLETPLRFLLYATVPGQEPQSVQECHDILNLWRQGLEKEARLVPDAYSGAVLPYEPGLERAYHINGRCEPGDPVLISVPAWRIQGEVVVRGEAEPMARDDAPRPEKPREEAPREQPPCEGAPCCHLHEDLCCAGVVV